MKLGASIVVAFLVCWLYLAAAVRDLDRNSALIGYREVTSERIVIKTSYGEVRRGSLFAPTLKVAAACMFMNRPCHESSITFPETRRARHMITIQIRIRAYHDKAPARHGLGEERRGAQLELLPA